MAQRSSRTALSVGALGVVFGDIGTSPLYAMHAVLGQAVQLDRAAIYGLTSMIIWTMTAVVGVTYVGGLMAVDNEGEGGLLALLALLRRTASRRAAAWTVVGMIGAAMFLGDSVITPAISVLAAAEGLRAADPSLDRYVLAIAVSILIGVFLIQRVGTGRIGRFYGPVMLVWFLALAATGARSLATSPEALSALSPHWAVLYFLAHPRGAYLAMGAVILTITGAEALYADLGHFGRSAITRSWLLIVFPALVLAYLGEAGAALRDPDAVREPFYAVVPEWATVPMIVLATLATVIASEAVIAGAFTVLHQAGGLGIYPYLRTRHPSIEHAGQLYLPAANWPLALAVLGVVLLFGSSQRMASAYGLAVTATILVSVLLYLGLARSRGQRGRAFFGAGMVALAVSLFTATLPKFASGGWLPTGIGLALFCVMWTWWRGRRRLVAARRSEERSTQDLLEDLARRGTRVHRIHGSAVFLSDDADVAPFALRHLLEHEGILHEHTVILSWQVQDQPTAQPYETSVRTECNDRYDGLVALAVTLGYRERLDVEHVLARTAEQEPDLLRGVDPDEATYFISDPIPQLTRRGHLSSWQQRLFVALDRMSTDRVEQLALPRDRSVVLGREFTL